MDEVGIPMADDADGTLVGDGLVGDPVAGAVAGLERAAGTVQIREEAPAARALILSSFAGNLSG